MVVDNVDIFGAFQGPAEAEAELVVNADTVLAGAVAAQGFQTVSGWRFQIGQGYGGVEHIEFSQGDLCDSDPTPAHAGTEKALRFVISKGADGPGRRYYVVRNASRGPDTKADPHLVSRCARPLPRGAKYWRLAADVLDVADFGPVLRRLHGSSDKSGAGD